MITDSSVGFDADNTVNILGKNGWAQNNQSVSVEKVIAEILEVEVALSHQT